MELLLSLLNRIPMLTNTFLAEALTLYVATLERKRFKCFLGFVAIKYIVVNVLVGSVMPHYIPITPGIRIFAYYIFVLAILLMVVGTKYVLNDGWEKVSIVLILAEGRCIVCTFVPAAFINAIWGYDLLVNISNVPRFFNALSFVISLLLIWVTQRPVKIFGRWIQRRTLRFPLFWKTVLLVYVMICIYTTIVTWGDAESLLLDEYPLIYVGPFLCLCILLCFAWQKKKQDELVTKNKLLFCMQDYIRQYYDSLQEQIELTRKYRHDMANHIQILKSLEETLLPEESSSLDTKENLQSYRRELEEQYGQVRLVEYCDNVVIDALLHQKWKRCIEEEIRFRVEIKEIKLEEISELDMISLLGNLLDNAIESCMKIHEKDSRFVTLKCKMAANQLFIIMENATSEIPEIEGSTWFTSKEDKDAHGIGMEIVKEIVSKYHGDMEQNCTLPVMHISINLPYTRC